MFHVQRAKPQADCDHDDSAPLTVESARLFNQPCWAETITFISASFQLACGVPTAKTHSLSELSQNTALPHNLPRRQCNIPNIFAETSSSQTTRRGFRLAGKTKTTVRKEKEEKNTLLSWIESLVTCNFHSYFIPANPRIYQVGLLYQIQFTRQILY